MTRPNSYIRDDGVEMVETRPGCFTRRDSLGLLDLTPMARRAPAAVTPPPIAPTHDNLAPEPAGAPPLQPSFADLVSDEAAVNPATSHAGFAEAYVAEVVATVGLPVAAVPAPNSARAPRPKPAKRPLSAILAEADRNQRTRKAKVRG